LRCRLRRHHAPWPLPVPLLCARTVATPAVGRRRPRCRTAARCAEASYVARHVPTCGDLSGGSARRAMGRSRRQVHTVRQAARAPGSPPPTCTASPPKTTTETGGFCIFSD
jgi:hypothetical protein